MNIFETSAVHDYFQFNFEGVFCSTHGCREYNETIQTSVEHGALAMKRLFGAAKQAWKDSWRLELRTLLKRNQACWMLHDVESI